MTDPAPSWWTPRRIAVAAGAVAVTIGLMVLCASPHFGWDTSLAVEGAVAGGLLGNLAWACVDMRRRVSRLGAGLVGLTLVAWLIFGLFGASHEASPEGRQADGSFVIIHDGPINVAGRSVGTFGSVNAADRVLGLMAHPALYFAARVVGLATGTIHEHSLEQSYIVAAIAAVLSVAWWLAFGDAVSVLRRWRARRAAERRVPG